MKIAIVGTGYVGLVTGTCFAEIGVNVICVDTNSEKIESLKKGVIPIYENGLEEMVSRNVKAGRLQFTTSLESCLNEVEVVFSAVGTPPDEDGSGNFQHIAQVGTSVFVRRRTDGTENGLNVVDTFREFRCEIEASFAMVSQHHFFQTRLINWYFSAFERRYLLRIDVNTRHLHAHFRKTSPGNESDISSANDCYLHIVGIVRGYRKDEVYHYLLPEAP